MELRVIASGAVSSQRHCQRAAITHADPEGDRDEPGRISTLTGPAIRAEGVGLNMSLCNEIRRVSQYCWWRRLEVRVLRQQELSFFPERWASSEDVGPGRRRRSCKLVVWDLQDVRLRTCNLLNCPRCLQRWGVVGLAPGEEVFDCSKHFGKWRGYRASQARQLPREGCRRCDCRRHPFRTTCERSPKVQDGNLQCVPGERRRQRDLP